MKTNRHDHDEVEEARAELKRLIAEGKRLGAELVDLERSLTAELKKHNPNSAEAAELRDKLAAVRPFLGDERKTKAVPSHRKHGGAS